MDVPRDRIPPPFSHGQLAALIEVLPNAYVFATDAAGECIYLNLPWAGLLGRPLEALLGRGWLESVDLEHRERVAEQWRVAVAGEQRFTSVHRVRSERESVWMAFEAVPLRSDGRVVGYAGSAHEVSEEILAASDVASRMLAHDLQDMLTVLGRHLERVSSRGALDPETTHAVREIWERAAEMTGELLGVRGGPVETDLNQLVERVILAVHPSLPRSVVIRLEVDPILEPLPAHPRALWRALLNLAFTARDVMSSGGVLTMRTRRLDPDASATRARITVLHTGERTPREDADGIREPAAPPQEDRARGRLRLEMVDACARLHRGSMRVENRNGSGSAYHLELAAG